MLEKVSFGVIGVGGISEVSHLSSIKTLPEAELVATCDKSMTRASEMAKKWGAKCWYTDYKQLLKRKDINAVLISTPNFLHHEMALAAIDAGKHVFCEKPLACTNKECDDIVEARKKAGTKFQVGHNQRFWMQYEISKKLIDAGGIGRILSCRSSLREDWKLYSEKVAYTNFRYQAKEAGAGVTLDICTHRLDLLRWLVGDIEKVFGITLHQASDCSMLDDNCWMLLRFQNNAIGAVDGDRYSPSGSDITELYGTGGTIFASSESFNPFQPVPLAIYTEKMTEDTLKMLSEYHYPPNWWTTASSKKWLTITPPREKSYFRQLKHFCECILRDKMPRITAEEGAKAVEATLAVFKSMETQTWVTLPLKEEVIPPGYK